jgi:hypothetical protein
MEDSLLILRPLPLADEHENKMRGTNGGLKFANLPKPEVPASDASKRPRPD